MSQIASDPYAEFFCQISLAGLAVVKSALVPGAVGLGTGIDMLVNNHCVLHGTPDCNVQSIQMNGFRDSRNGMLGPGVYGAHSYDKAAGFAGDKGTVFCVTFKGGKVNCTKMPDKSGSWQKKGYDCVYCDRPGRRSEMCFPAENIHRVENYTGSLSQKTRLKIDEHFLKHPKLREATVYIGVAADIFYKSRAGALVGACVGVAMSSVIDILVGKSSKVTKKQIEEAFDEDQLRNCCWPWPWRRSGHLCCSFRSYSGDGPWRRSGHLVCSFRSYSGDGSGGWGLVGIDGFHYDHYGCGIHHSRRCCTCRFSGHACSICRSCQLCRLEAAKLGKCIHHV